jgi:16S rRNA (guanine966-N2)-methyltransferase
MRVISGTYKGRNLRSIRDPRVRPATNRVRESIFNILQNRISLRGACVLDLFAGTGSLGFEALSRGATRVTFVDEWLGATKVIEENVKLLHCEEQCEVIKADVYKFLGHAEGQFDLIFIDPPYRLEGVANLPYRVFEQGLLSPSGLLIMEHTVRATIASDGSFSLILERTFGSTRVSFFAPLQPKSGEQPTTQRD